VLAWILKPIQYAQPLRAGQRRECQLQIHIDN
jgi:hypothetical protein